MKLRNQIQASHGKNKDFVTFNNTAVTCFREDS